jgi:hypothetical protein
MAIIKYSAVLNTTTGMTTIPSGVTDGNYWHDVENDFAIGVGTSGGTVLTKSEFIEYVKSLDLLANPNGDTNIKANDSEKTTMANDWCTARGIS